MKRCPSCHRGYPDDSLTYCLEDGSILSTVPDPDATLVIPDRRLTDRTESDSATQNLLPSSKSPYLWAGLVLIIL